MFRLCLRDVHVHLKHESSDGMLTVRYVEAMMALEKIGVYTSDKECDGNKQTNK